MYHALCKFDMISTHALREEGDRTGRTHTPGDCTISTHALREEGDAGQSIIWVQNEQISTHALREEGDWTCTIALTAWTAFLPTPSARRAT